MSSTELTANLPQGINTFTVLRVAGKEKEENPELAHYRNNHQRGSPVQSGRAAAFFAKQPFDTGKTRPLVLRKSFGSECHRIKERSENNEKSKHVSGVMRLVLRSAVRTIAAGWESVTRMGSKPTGHFNANLSRHRDRADYEGD
jgi:hypothetical protein